MYENGRVPLDLLFRLPGTNFYFFPGTWQRWVIFVTYCRDKWGFEPHITNDVDGLGGWNVYRPYTAQVRYRAHYGIGAAVPGTSSHGGTYAGASTGWVKRESCAIDVNNWAALGWARFKEAANYAGFAVDVVVPQEKWHIVDFNPWTLPAGGGGTPFPTPTPPAPPQIGKGMSTLYYCTDNDLPNGKVLSYAYAGDGNGAAAWLAIGDPTLANALAANTLSKVAVHLSRGTFSAWQSAYLSPQPVSGIVADVGDVTVTVDNAAIAKAVNDDAAKRMSS